MTTQSTSDLDGFLALAEAVVADIRRQVEENKKQIEDVDGKRRAEIEMHMKDLVNVEIALRALKQRHNGKLDEFDERKVKLEQEAQDLKDLIDGVQSTSTPAQPAPQTPQAPPATPAPQDSKEPLVPLPAPSVPPAPQQNGNQAPTTPQPTVPPAPQGSSPAADAARALSKPSGAGDQYKDEPPEVRDRQVYDVRGWQFIAWLSATVGGLVGLWIANSHVPLVNVSWQWLMTLLMWIAGFGLGFVLFGTLVSFMERHDGTPTTYTKVVKREAQPVRRRRPRR